MRNKNAPWFALDVHDWLTSIDIQRMTLAEVGAYINLLARAWDSDPIATLPSDPSKLWKLAGARSLAEFDAVAPVVLAMFEELDGKLVNRRLLKETARLSVAEATRAEKARNAATARWGKPDAPACSSMLNDACDAKQRTETDSDIERKPNQSVTESVGSLDHGSQSQPSQPGDSAPTPQSPQLDLHAALCNGPLPAFRWAEQMVQKWNSLRKEVNYRCERPEMVLADDFAKLVSQNWLLKAGFQKPIPRGEIELCMTWALKVSRKKKPTDKGHWGNPNVLDGSAGFVHAFATIRAQCLNYYNSIKSQKKAIAERNFYNFDRMREESAPFEDGSAPVTLPEPSGSDPVTTQSEPTRFVDNSQKKLMNECLADMDDMVNEGMRDSKWIAKRFRQLTASGMSMNEANVRIDLEKKGKAAPLSAAQIAQIIGAEKLVEEAA
jgi:uncharacterized protein YdaU (DUF1376 family)